MTYVRQHRFELSRGLVTYWRAREEHAFYLRTREAKTWRAVGDCLGVCHERARQLYRYYNYRAGGMQTKLDHFVQP